MEGRGGLNIGILYLSLHNQMIKKWGVNHLVSRREFHIFLGKHFLIPRHIRDATIIELENLDLLKKIDKEFIRVLDYGFSLENDANKLFQKLGIF
jgi:hypothetical protein